MQAVLLGSTFAWLAAVAWSDWHHLRVGNRLVGAAAVLLLLSAATGFHPWGQSFLASVCGALLVLGIGLPLFRMGWVAAGDVKVLAVLGALFGPGTALVATWALASLLAAVHVGAWLLLRSCWRGLALAPSDPGAGHRRRLPHAAHLALAAALMLACTHHA